MKRKPSDLQDGNRDLDKTHMVQYLREVKARRKSLEKAELEAQVALLSMPDSLPRRNARLHATLGHYPTDRTGITFAGSALWHRDQFLHNLQLSSKPHLIKQDLASASARASIEALQICSKSETGNPLSGLVHLGSSDKSDRLRRIMLNEFDRSKRIFGDALDATSTRTGGSPRSKELIEEVETHESELNKPRNDARSVSGEEQTQFKGLCIKRNVFFGGAPPTMFPLGRYLGDSNTFSLQKNKLASENFKINCDKDLIVFKSISSNGLKSHVAPQQIYHGFFPQMKSSRQTRAALLKHANVLSQKSSLNKASITDIDNDKTKPSSALLDAQVERLLAKHLSRRMRVFSNPSA